MSRTDKTDPWWVTCEYYEPLHYRCRFARWRGDWGARVCDLPEIPVRRSPHSRRRFPYLEGCVWTPGWPAQRWQRWHRGPSVPKWYRDHVWTNAERVRMRGEARLMVAQFNATGAVDHEPQSWQHRHKASWMWD